MKRPYLAYEGLPTGGRWPQRTLNDQDFASGTERPTLDEGRGRCPSSGPKLSI